MVKFLKLVAAAGVVAFASGGFTLAQEAPADQAQITTVEALIAELLASDSSADALNEVDASALTPQQIAFAFGVAAQLSGQGASGVIETSYQLWLGNMPNDAGREVLAAQFASGAQSASQGTAGGGSGFFGGSGQGSSGGSPTASGSGGAGTGGGGGASPT